MGDSQNMDNMRADSIQKTYVPAKCRAMVVSIDSLHGNRYDCYELDNKGWNGWACPGFTLEIALDMLKDSDSVLTQFKYDETYDVIMMRFENGETEVWAGSEYETEHGTKKLYAVGAWSWCWSHEMYGHLK